MGNHVSGCVCEGCTISSGSHSDEHRDVTVIEAGNGRGSCGTDDGVDDCDDEDGLCECFIGALPFAVVEAAAAAAGSDPDGFDRPGNDDWRIDDRAACGEGRDGGLPGESSLTCCLCSSTRRVCASISACVISTRTQRRLLAIQQNTIARAGMLEVGHE